MNVAEMLGSIRSWQEELYRDLHAHPELSHEEHRTAAVVAAQLRDRLSTPAPRLS
jgi:metal-dependent amidase/aminoacylase/carboxypeptidase family protein